MASRQILPDAAYDWWVHDSRDGERWGPFDDRRKASARLRGLRACLVWYQRSVYQVIREVNERKVLRLIRGGDHD